MSWFTKDTDQGGRMQPHNGVPKQRCSIKSGLMEIKYIKKVFPTAFQVNSNVESITTFHHSLQGNTCLNNISRKFF